MTPRWRRSFVFPACCAQDVEDYLGSQGIQIWSADFPGRRLAAYSVVAGLRSCDQTDRGQGKGHSAAARHPAANGRRAAEDPAELKARGYRIVHVVPATADLPATPTEPQQWQLHPPSENVAISHWPKIPNFVFARLQVTKRRGVPAGLPHIPVQTP
jgi:hypothetical protein